MTRAMRVAVSGSHATGKSTLVRELAERLPDFTAIDEPYYLLAEEGTRSASRRLTMTPEALPAQFYGIGHSISD